MLSIGLMGDVMIGRLVNERLNHQPPHYIWGDILPLLKSTDLNLINLEAALTKSRKIVPKVFNFKADPEKVAVLQEGSIHVVNIANNHILDYAEEGLLETISTLDKANILHVGAGHQDLEAKAPAIVTRKGMRIGILGCTDNEPSWKASQSHSGTYFVRVGDRSAIQESIRNLRNQVDLLILSMHWGPNMRERPSSAFVRFAHQLIEAGVDIFHGHSAHVFQGVEIYRGKLILYDTGDFVDDYMVDPILRNDRSFFFSVEVGREKLVSLRLVPVLISNCQVNRAEGDESEEAIQKMQQLSKEFGTELIRDQETLVFHF